MDLADLLKPHGDGDPSGENLEYDPAFMSLEIAAQPGEERQIGDSIIAAEDPDHPEVISNALDVLGRSHDLRAAVFLSYSYLRTRGFPGFAEATGYIRGVLEQYWDTCHPQLDADDDNDPTMRVNAVKSLADLKTIVPGIRLAPLTDSRTFGRLALKDIQIAEGELAGAEGAEGLPDSNQVAAAFQDTDPDRLEVIRSAVAKAHADVKAIGEVFDVKVPTRGPDLDELEKVLRQVLQKFSAAGISDPSGAAEDVPDAGAEAAPVSGGGGQVARGPMAGGGPPGSVNSQADARAAIDRIIQYYARSEPSSPVPILLERAKRLVGADFMTIIRELAPEGESNVNLIAGVKPGDDDD